MSTEVLHPLPTRRSLRARARLGFTDPGRALAFAVIGVGAILLVQAVVAPALVTTFGPLVGDGAAWSGPVLTWAIMLVVPLLAVRYASDNSLPASLGLRARWIDVPLGLAVGLGIRVIVEFGAPTSAGAGRALVDFSDPHAASAFAWGVTGSFVTVAVIAPILEELFFRGHLQRSIQQLAGPAGRRSAKLPALVGIVSTTLVFVAVHVLITGASTTLPLVLGTLAVGVGCGLIAARTNRIGGAMIAHAAFNATGLAIFYLA